MSRILLRRATASIGVIAALIALAFFATHVIGDPVLLLTDRELTTEADRAAIVKAGGFDRPIGERFLEFVGGAVRGDFGRSIWQNRPASQVVVERLPATFLLAGATLLATIGTAVPAAILAARRPGSWIDGAITTASTALGSVASFWWALVLILVFAVQLGVLPSSGYGTWQHLILPVLALCPQPVARVTQVLRAQLLDQLQQGYVATARSKGLSGRDIVFGHVLRNSVIGAVTVLGGELVVLLSVAVLVESIFAWPGIGQVTLQAIQRRDLPVVMASVFYTGLLVTMVNFLVDTAYSALDPRIRFT